MAVVWRGSLVTPYIGARPETGEPVFAVVNTARSRNRVNVLRFITVGDSLELSATAGHIMPLLKTWRCAAENVAGGVPLVARPPWDTAVNAPDPGIRLLFGGGADGARITATGLQGPVWQQFTQRAATAVRQRRTLDNSLLSRLTTVSDFIIDPGQAIVVTWGHGVQPTGGQLFFAFAWEEDEVDPGYTLGGTVTSDGNPVEGAVVHVLTDTVSDMTNPERLRLTTDAGGAWSVTLATGLHAAAFVQHRIGATFYTDQGKPFLGAD
jgi:hypothetical protein